MTATRAGSSRLFVPWVLLATGCSVLMWMTPGEETIPYHVAWIGIALAYGIEPWRWLQALWSVLAYTLLTGGILVARAATGVIAWGETAEIPLMSVLVLVVVWNVRKRHDAHARLARIAERDRAQAQRRERLSRMTTHEMRTPATIAIGYAEMLMARESDPQRREDLQVIRDELTRLVLVGSRLIRSMQIHDREDLRAQDLRVLLQETADRWSVLAERDWRVSCAPITHVCSPSRLRACLDTLVENALRYTEEGDTVRLVGRLEDGTVLVGVADSGPGIRPELLDALARGEFRTGILSDSYTYDDPKSQTGLGLALVQEAADIRGGTVVAGRSEEGGALVLMAVPHRGALRHVTPWKAPRATTLATAED